MARESYFTTYSKVFTALKDGKLPSTIFLYGPEYLLRRKFLEQCRESFLSRYPQGGEVQVIWADEPDSLNFLWEALSGGELFSQARLVIVQGLEHWSRQLAGARNLKRLTDRLQKLSPDTFLLLSTEREPPFPKWLEAVRQLCTEVPVRKPWPNESLRIIQRMAAWRGKKLSFEAAQLLHDSFDGDLGIIDQELGKIVLGMAADREAIDTAAVREAVGGQGIYSLDRLLAAFENRRPEDFLKALIALDAGGKTAMTYLVVRLYHSIMNLLAIALGLPPEGRPSARQRAAANKYSVTELQGALHHLADIDRRIRTGAEGILDNFVPWVARWMES